jgi:hypothetical protein
MIKCAMGSGSRPEPKTYSWRQFCKINKRVGLGLACKYTLSQNKSL